jgi:hypothetical protein
LPESFIRKGEACDLLLKVGCYIDSESCFIKRETIRQIAPLDESLRYTCDYDFFIRAGLSVDFAYSSDVLAAWRVHAGQATRTFGKIRHEERIVFRRYLRNDAVGLGAKAMLIKRLCTSLGGEVVDKIRS